MFAVENGRVRLRRDIESAGTSADLARSAGVFLIADDTVNLLLSVSRDMLRGSGRSPRRAVADLLGVTPGGTCVLRHHSGDTAVSWPFTSTDGPQLLAQATPWRPHSPTHGAV